MREINRSSGTTLSERYLAKVANITFLNLWTYPNVYRNQQQRGRGDGKELCDLLVVCGNDVIIFSDKSVDWSTEASLDVAWCRWYKKAINNSVKQIRGAERWIREFPDRIYLDKACTCPLPIELPPIESRRFHSVVIALGATEACKAHFNDPAGSFRISSQQIGQDHLRTDKANFNPFLLGDVDSTGSFVHIFDRSAADLLFRLLDTISDFAEYLERRAHAIRSGRIKLASGEDDLVAYYLSNVGADGMHDFCHPRDRERRPHEALCIQAGYFRYFSSSPGFLKKIKADEVSYCWDRLIETFTDNVIAGTSVTLSNGALTPALAERALRTMARECRLSRRLLGECVKGAYEEMIRRRQHRLARIILPGPHSVDKSCAYILMILAFPSHLIASIDYQRYREVRMRMLETYCFSLLLRYRNIMNVVGIGVDAPYELTGREGGSEDLMAVGQQDWTPAFATQVEERRVTYKILEDFSGAGTPIEAEEYPASSERSPPMTRQQRRAIQRADIKRKRRRHHHPQQEEKCI